MGKRRSEKDEKTKSTPGSSSQTAVAFEQDMSHFTDEQKKIISDQIESEHDARKVTYLDIYKFATKTEICLDLIGLVAAAASGTCQPLMIFVFGNIITAFVNYGSAVLSGQNLQAVESQLLREVDRGALLLVYIGIAMAITTYLYSAIWMYNGENCSRRIREAYLRAALRQNLAYWDSSNAAGEVTARITGDMAVVQRGISEKVAIGTQYIAQFFAGFVVAFIKDWRLALALSSILPIMVIAGSLISILETKYKDGALASLAKGGSLAEEAFSAVRTVYAYSTQKKLSLLYDVHNIKAMNFGKKNAFSMSVIMAIFYWTLYSGYALAIWLGTRFVYEGRATSGDIIACIEAVLIGAFSISSIAPNVQAIGSATGAANKILHTIWRIPPIDSASTEGTKLEKVQGRIEFRNVDFYYPSRPGVKVLDNYSLMIPENKVTALVGQSGSGKSSVVGLLERFYNVTAGKVFLDGHDMSTLNVRWLRSQIGLVSQEPTLFAAQVWQNVALGLVDTPHEHSDEDTKRKMVEEACKIANAHTFISALPNGYGTLVGERGLTLSGGQKQRIAIARAIISNPPILLLDEATSALDVASERLVQRALDQASAGRTVIAIAHRLSTIKAAHQIVVMTSGRIIESGTHESLLEGGGTYAGLVKSQTLAAEAASQDLDEEKDDGSAMLEKDAQPSEKLTRRNTDLSAKDATVAGDAETPKRKRASLLVIAKRLIQANPGVWKFYLAGLVGSGVVGLAIPLVAIILGSVVDVLTLPDRQKWQPGNSYNAGLTFALACVLGVLSIVQFGSFMYAAERLCRRLRLGLFESTLRQDVSFYDDASNSTGALSSNVSELPQKVNAACGITAAAITQSVVTLITGVIIGLVYAWKIALVGLACVPLTFGAGLVRLKVVETKDQKTEAVHSQAAQKACEAAAAIRTVTALSTQDTFCREYSRSLDEPMKLAQRVAFISTAFFSITQALSFWILALVFWYGCRQLVQNGLSPGNFFVALTGVIFGSIEAGQIFGYVPDISGAKTGAAKIFRLLDQQPEIDADSPEGDKPANIGGHIVFKNVHFRYPTRPGVRVLSGLDIEVQPGQFIALVGPSGSGKSTIVQLMERFYNPWSGSITLDGQDIRNINLQSLRASISFVSQEPTLFEGTVRHNIVIGALKEPSQEDIEAACRSANIHDFVASLPQGYDTPVGGKGSQLSGGQKQRVAIARALIRNPKILLLDEATSALDSNSEKVVQEALDAAAKNRTTLAIAHRLSTIQRADLICVLRDGRIAEKGTHQELLQKRGLYYELVMEESLNPTG